MNQLYLSRIGRTIQVPDKTYHFLVVYKMMFPPETKMVFGKKKVALKDIQLQPPPEQEILLRVDQKVTEKKRIIDS